MAPLVSFKRLEVITEMELVVIDAAFVSDPSIKGPEGIVEIRVVISVWYSLCNRSYSRVACAMGSVDVMIVEEVTLFR